MMIHSVKDMLQRCHQRREEPLRQKKTIVMPSTYKSLYYNFTVYYAYKKPPVELYALEEADVSFMPIGRAPANNRMPRSFGGERFLTRQRVGDWKIRQWHSSWGIRVYTGIPSEREGAPWHDLEFTYQALCANPNAVLACIETLINIVANPLLTLTPSGGIRFSCRVPHYLHAHTESAKFYIYKDIPTEGDLYERNVYLEIRGSEGHSPWDARYEILSGDLLNPPIIAKEVLLRVIDALRAELHEPAPDGTVTLKSDLETVTISLPSLGSRKLDLAKEAFLKRGFSYLCQENGLHYWTRHGREDFGKEVSLWEGEGAIWIQALKSDLGLPMEATPITDVWNDTGILPRVGDAELSVSEEMLAVREAELSPLAIKRPVPVLQKSEDTEKVYEPLEKSIHQIEGVFDTGARVVGLNAEMKARNSYALESYLFKNNPVCFIGNFPMVEEAVRHFDRQNLPSLERHRGYRFQSGAIKDVPVDVRMATPFQRGNVCEDPDRFVALVHKGVDPSETLCPRCPVYAECQQRGYLSQPEALQQAEAQIFGLPNLFLNPDNATLVEKTIRPLNNTERLCIINELDLTRLFLECLILRSTLEVWTVNWEGYALGNFAQALLRALETKNQPDDIIVKRLRTLFVAFEPSESEIVRQMCQINVKGRIIERGIVDKNTGTELARFMVTFEGGASAYIPLNGDAADRLTADGVQVFDLEAFGVDEDMRIPMSISQAIELGILDIGTVEKIQAFPKVYPHPGWTFWHQLKRFLTHYRRDADAPIIWHNDVLRFWVPPVLHPNVQRLLVTSSQMSEKDLGSLFPAEKIEAVRIKRTPWVPGSQLFQMRTGVHSLKTILDYDNNWDIIGLSKTGERFLLGICAEIERDPSVKHGIITYSPIIDQISDDVADKENVCLLRKFRKLYNLDAAFEAAEVVWIVGTPYWDTGVIWRQAQLIFGNDAEPLCYDADTEFQHYKDERVQRIYTQIVSGLITDIIGRVGLNHCENKKVVLMSSLDIPDITDRPETLLFDWEDFEIAGGLDKLAETIATRERFEAERDSLTAESSRAAVERILGCSSRQANRVLYGLRGGYLRPATFREQILSLLADGEKKAAEMIAVIEGNPGAVYHELRRLVKMGEIVKVRRGVYNLPET